MLLVVDGIATVDGKRIIRIGDLHMRMRITLPLARWAYPARTTEPAIYSLPDHHRWRVHGRTPMVSSTTFPVPLRITMIRCACARSGTGVLGTHIGSASQALHQGSHPLATPLMHYGFTSADAGTASLGFVYEQLLRQSVFLAFMDCFRVIGWITLFCLPLIFAVRPFEAAGEAPAAH